MVGWNTQKIEDNLNCVLKREGEFHEIGRW
jgi:hypothetical protein